MVYLSLKLVYNNQVMKLKVLSKNSNETTLCSEKEFVTLEEFEDIVKPYMPTNWRDECKKQ